MNGEKTNSTKKNYETRITFSHIFLRLCKKINIYHGLTQSLPLQSSNPELLILQNDRSFSNGQSFKVWRNLIKTLGRYKGKRIETLFTLTTYISFMPLVYRKMFIDKIKVQIGNYDLVQVWSQSIGVLFIFWAYIIIIFDILLSLQEI